MDAAGSNGSNIANKYKSKGLRVIAVDKDGQSKEESVLKWKAAGANYPLYTFSNEFSFSYAPFFAQMQGYPYNVAIKNWKPTQINATEIDIKYHFDF